MKTRNQQTLRKKRVPMKRKSNRCKAGVNKWIWDDDKEFNANELWIMKLFN